MMDKSITDLERQVALEQFEKRQREIYIKGKAIIAIIAVLNIVGSIGTAFSNFNLLMLIIQITLSIALFSGVSWVRYLFAIGAAIGAMYILWILLGGTIDFSSVPNFRIAILLIYMVYCIVSSIILFASKSVTEFMYSQKNG